MDPSTARTLRPHEYVVELNGAAIRVHCPPDGPLEVNGKKVSARLHASNAGHGYLELDDVRYKVCFEGEEARGREFAIEINGHRISGTVDDQRSLLRLRMVGALDADRSGAVIKAPMPGLVLKIQVTIGQAVGKGQPLLVLEAMKMENEVKSDRSGVVEAILVTEKGPVEKGQPMIQIATNP